MSIGEVQARIEQIRTMMVSATGVTRAATGATSGSEFAAALQSALGAGGTGSAAGSTAGSAVPGDAWVRPTTGQISSGFGPRWGTQHEGLDIAAGMGTTVRAATDGVVKKASWYGGYGNAVIIDHGNGVKTLYGHNSKLLVEPGERVRAGQPIAKVGSTGDSTGPHLHFEVEIKGKKIDPKPWLKKHGVTF